MEAGCAGAGDDVDLAAACTAHVCGIAARLYLELLHRIGRGAHVLGTECGIRVGRPVEQEVIPIGAASADTHGRTLTGTPIKGIHIASSGAVASVRSRDRQHKIDQHAAVQGEGID